MGASSVQGRIQLEMGGRARAEADKEHVAHVRDARGVETQRLVERRRPLTSGKGTREEGVVLWVSEQVVRQCASASSVQERNQLDMGGRA